jgi:hypothetical protein
MTTLSVPSLIVINATNYLHHIPEEHTEIITPENLADFLNRILQNDIQVEGNLIIKFFFSLSFSLYIKLICNLLLLLLFFFLNEN